MRVEQTIAVDAPRDEVWERIKDPVEYAGLLDWVTTFEPQDPDVDEIYDDVMRRMQDVLESLSEERRLPVIG